MNDECIRDSINSALSESRGMVYYEHELGKYVLHQIALILFTVFSLKRIYPSISTIC